MKAAVIPSVIGILGFSEDGKILDGVVFSRDAVKVAEKLFNLEQGKLIPEIIDLVEKLKRRNYTEFIFESREIAEAMQNELNVKTKVEDLTGMSESLREKMGEVSVEMGLFKEPSEITHWIHEVTMELSKLRVKKATEKRDLLIVQAIQALDDLDQTLNLFMSRLREWYGVHFPELSRLIDKHETYVRLAYKLGRKENFTVEDLEKEGFPRNKALQIAQSARSSMGADLQEIDIEHIQEMCKNVLQLYETRSSIEKYIDTLMEEVAPNLRALAGSSLGARLISLAGGLESLAKMPSSTVQVLGAEKALFRSLTTGARPPKHGIIFQHALIYRARRWLRGKIARALAGKLAIAARTDAFTGNYMGDKLKEELQERIEEIERKYPEPKPKHEKSVKKPKKPKPKKR